MRIATAGRGETRTGSPLPASVGIEESTSIRSSGHGVGGSPMMLFTAILLERTCATVVLEVHGKEEHHGIGIACESGNPWSVGIVLVHGSL